MSNPLEDYFGPPAVDEKVAALPMSHMPSFGSHMQQAVSSGLAGAAVSAGIAGVGVAANKMFEAATKRRDFNAMLAHHPDLEEMHQQNPAAINQMFSTLRTFNPQFSAEPMVAGHYIRKMMENPGNIGGIATDALTMRDKLPENPVFESFHRGGAEGAKAGITENYKHHSMEAQSEKSESSQNKLEDRRESFRLRHPPTR